MCGGGGEGVAGPAKNNKIPQNVRFCLRLVVCICICHIGKKGGGGGGGVGGYRKSLPPLPLDQASNQHINVHNNFFLNHENFRESKSSRKEHHSFVVLPPCVHCNMTYVLLLV